MKMRQLMQARTRSKVTPISERNFIKLICNSYYLIGSNQKATSSATELQKVKNQSKSTKETFRTSLNAKVNTKAQQQDGAKMKKAGNVKSEVI